jgi:hypothetical protein
MVSPHSTAASAASSGEELEWLIDVRRQQLDMGDLGNEVLGHRKVLREETPTFVQGYHAGMTRRITEAGRKAIAE